MVVPNVILKGVQQAEKDKGVPPACAQTPPVALRMQFRYSQAVRATAEAWAGDATGKSVPLKSTTQEYTLNH